MSRDTPVCFVSDCNLPHVVNCCLDCERPCASISGAISAGTVAVPKTACGASDSGRAVAGLLSEFRSFSIIHSQSTPGPRLGIGSRRQAPRRFLVSHFLWHRKPRTDDGGTPGGVRPDPPRRVRQEFSRGQRRYGLRPMSSRIEMVGIGVDLLNRSSGGQTAHGGPRPRAAFLWPPVGQRSQPAAAVVASPASHDSGSKRRRSPAWDTSRHVEGTRHRRGVRRVRARTRTRAHRHDEASRPGRVCR